MLTNIVSNRETFHVLVSLFTAVTSPWLVMMMMMMMMMMMVVVVMMS